MKFLSQQTADKLKTYLAPTAPHGSPKGYVGTRQTTFVQITKPEQDDGYYRAKPLAYFPVFKFWEDYAECKAFDVNSESLEVGKRYLATNYGPDTDGLSVYAARGTDSDEQSEGSESELTSATFSVMTDKRPTDCGIEYDMTTYRVYGHNINIKISSIDTYGFQMACCDDSLSTSYTPPDIRCSGEFGATLVDHVTFMDGTGEFAKLYLPYTMELGDPFGKTYVGTIPGGPGDNGMLALGDFGCTGLANGQPIEGGPRIVWNIIRWQKTNAPSADPGSPWPNFPEAFNFDSVLTYDTAHGAGPAIIGGEIEQVERDEDNNIIHVIILMRTTVGNVRLDYHVGI
ncbi:hypothetical protein [Limnoglobus roseus]|uniref:Uncharacterized protein n=1 Tax=Limnoglobus roseus TaxID=2598579 RepID=A0A5C1AB07_9BACT|nr:hypothetical protein [Limnoglobus roseus]QEL16559.1 hypothetical protein PX52LOC_03519 [Limnoglobus roseus]